MHTLLNIFRGTEKLLKEGTIASWSHHAFDLAALRHRVLNELDSRRAGLQRDSARARTRDLNTDEGEGKAKAKPKGKSEVKSEQIKFSEFKVGAHGTKQGPFNLPYTLATQVARL